MPTLNDTQRKIVALNALAANFGQEFPDALLSMWLDILKPYSVGQVQAACRHVVMHYEYKTLPPLAIVLKAIPGFVPALQKRSPEETHRDEAIREWQIFDENAHRSAPMPKNDVTTTGIAALRCIGGWDALRQCLEKNLPFLRRDFIDAYTRIARYGVTTWEAGTPAIEAAASGSSTDALPASTFMPSLTRYQ